MQIYGLSSWSDDRCVCFFLESRNEVTRGFVIFGGRSWWRQGGFEPLVLVRPIFHFLVFVAWHIVIRFSRCWRGERIWKTEMAFSFDETFFFLLLKNVHCIVHDFPWCFYHKEYRIPTKFDGWPAKLSEKIAQIPKWITYESNDFIFELHSYSYLRG